MPTLDTTVRTADLSVRDKEIDRLRRITVSEASQSHIRPVICELKISLQRDTDSQWVSKTWTIAVPPSVVTIVPALLKARRAAISAIRNFTVRPERRNRSNG